MPTTAGACLRTRAPHSHMMDETPHRFRPCRQRHRPQAVKQAGLACCRRVAFHEISADLQGERNVVVRQRWAACIQGRQGRFAVPLHNVSAACRRGANGNNFLLCGAHARQRRGHGCHACEQDSRTSGRDKAHM